MRVIEEKEAAVEPNHRARLFNYYQYLFDKANKEDSFSDIRVDTGSVETKLSSPCKRAPREHPHDSLTIAVNSSELSSLPQKRRRKKKLQEKISSLLNEEEQSAASVKLPPLRKSEASEEERGGEWKRFYNEHKLESVVIDKSIIRLMEENQQRERVRHRQSLS
jgi:hypothetical protein